MTKARKIATADAETDPFKRGRIPEPFLWGFYDGDEYLEFKSTEEFVLHVYDKDIVIYAHNGGKFDWHFLLPYIEEQTKLTVIAGRLAKFKIGQAEFRDSYNLIPAPLAAYKKTEISYDIFEKEEREKQENKKLISEYLKDDCIYLYEIVSSFVENYGRHLTQAGAAMNFWAKMSKIEKPKTNAIYYDRIKQFYYGGRVECFYTGTISEPFKVADINSAYPKAMYDDHLWGSNYEIFDSLENFDEAKIKRSFIILNARSTGAFPFRGDNGLSFPNDYVKRKFYITGWEYLAAIETETLIDAEILSVYSFYETINFKEYVDHFYNMKNEAKKTGDKAGYIFAKIFLNALYGKFASNPDKYEEFKIILTQDLEKECVQDSWNYCRQIDDETSIVNRKISDETKRFYNIAVGASITGYVRAYLWKSICQAKDVLYCDTDCIVARDVGNLEIGEKLGQWDIEANCVSGAIAGKKLYAFKKDNGEYKTASKGVRLSASEIIAVARGATLTGKSDAPTFSVKNQYRFVDRKIRKT